VELDDFLGGAPIQHREVSGHESHLFLSYFEKLGGIRLLEGGVESGFNHVKPESYTPRLLHLKGRKNIRVTQVPIEVKSLNEDDVFVLDKGMDIYVWQGKKAGKNEIARAAQLAQAMDDERRGKPTKYTYRQGDKDETEFFAHFPGGKVPGAGEIAPDGGDDDEWEKASAKRLYQLSDASGALEFKMVAETTIHKKHLNTNDVFIFDIGCEVFVWIGAGASATEKTEAMKYGQIYLTKHTRPAFLPVTKLLEGMDSHTFNSSFDREK